MPLERKVAACESFLAKNMFHPCGIMYSHYAMTDPNGRQFLPELDWMRYVFSAHKLALTSLAWRRAERLGITLA